jgi:ectoine hydroxylase-related dioxygenase (phytanoyl-CoA dioxygenase family)
MLTDEQVAEYHERGYVIAPGVLTGDEVAALRAEVDAMWRRCGEGALSQNTHFRGVKKMSTLRDPQLHSALFMRCLTHPSLTSRMAQLVGPNVQLHHCKINVKTSDDAAVFPLHQDYPYFPHQQHSVCTVLVHLTDTTSERGCFRAVPGVRQPLPHIDDDGHILDPQEWPLERGEELPARAGDVVFMNYLVPHGSNLNQTAEPRVLWIIQVRAAEDRPVEQPAGTRQPTAPGNRPSQGAMLRGVNPDFSWTASGGSSRL